MDPMTQVLLTVAIPTVMVLVSILINNSRLTDMNSRISDLKSYVDMRSNSTDKRIDDLKDTMRAEFAAMRAGLLRVEEVLDARLKHLEDRVK